MLKVSGYDTIVERIYNYCKTSVVENVETESCLSLQDQVEFKNYSRKYLNHLGLERMMVRSYLEDISTRRKYMIDRIHDLQGKRVHLSFEDRAELIRSSLDRTSRPSCLFAVEKARAVSDFCYC